MDVCRRCSYLAALEEAWSKLQRAFRGEEYDYTAPDVVRHASTYMQVLETVVTEAPDVAEYLPAA